MKKIVIYCGVNSKTESTYLLMKDSFHNLPKDNRIKVLNELIEELQHELHFIKGYSQDISKDHPQFVGQLVLHDEPSKLKF